MIKNYFKTAWRNMLKNKAFSIINLLGLSIGISVCFVIMLFVQDELSYDRFNVKADRIVRVLFKSTINGSKINEATVMPPTAQALKNDYPEVEEATRLHAAGKPKITFGDKKFKDAEFAFVDANFFSVFTLHFLKGDASALQQPNTIVVTNDFAKKCFGDEDPIGKTLQLNNNNSELYKVTGVIDKIPANAHFHFDLFGSMAGDMDAKSDSWMTSNYFTYLLLKEGHKYKDLEAKLPGMVEKYMGPQILKAMGMSLSQFRTKGNQLGFALQPLKDIHLHSDSSFEMEPGGDIKYVYIFGAVAVFMLLIACINFINLSTASASKRAKEVGVRKVMGSGKFDLVKQFLVESVVLTFIALLLSFLVVELVLPLFNDLSGKHLSIGFSIRPLLMLFGIGLLVGVLAGIYPAFFLSSFNPIATLKGRLSASTKSLGLRSGLVVFQFFISISLIVGTIIIYQQMRYIQNKKLGYNKEQLLVLPNSWALGKNEKIFKEELLKDSRVANVTISPYKPAGTTDNNNSMAYPEGREDQIMKTLKYHVDEQYIPTLGMQLIAGRNFSPAFATDSSAIIINETAVKAFQLPANPVGKNILWIRDNEGHRLTYHIIGVVKDFHFRSLHEAITPLMMALKPEWGIIVKTRTADIAGLLSTMKLQWLKFNPEEIFEYAFMDELYNKTYLAEQKTSRILNIFAVLTILVACMGLFGLATYTAEQRTKEIGIRKVLGATLTQVTNMLSKEFLKLVLIACIIAFPLAWWGMNKWLEGFVYRIAISWWVFTITALAAMALTLLTVSFQALKAALMNPVKSLKSE